MWAKRRNIQLELALEPEAKGEALRPGHRGTEACVARADPEHPAAGRGPSMEAVDEPGNPTKAPARVRRRAPGLDGMTVEELGGYLKEYSPEVRSRLLDGSYTPQPVRRVEMPKASARVWRLEPPVAPVAHGGLEQPRALLRAAQRLLRPARPGALPWHHAQPVSAVEPLCTDPYARWCGRGGAVRVPPIPISAPRRNWAFTVRFGSSTCSLRSRVS